mmetsp:Transcript_38610/g.122737  ORF Transcript_38610/g.122737 Transcript_38610/m.122737 type:complete len:215 (+) Transcript_38610:275-919(+)
MAKVGMTSMEVPLSMTAPQPLSHPRMVGKANCACLASSIGTPAKPSRSASPRLARPRGSLSQTPVRFRVHVCLATTGTRMKSEGFSRTAVSFHTKKPSVPGFDPKHTEKKSTPMVLSMGVLCVIATATSVLLITLFVVATGGMTPLWRYLCTVLICDCAVLQASAAGVSGGPTPMMAWNSALISKGIWACVTSQKVWLTLPAAAKDTKSNASLE